MKQCRVCANLLTKENWMPSLEKKNCAICRECNNAKGREWRKNNREKFNKYSLERYFKNPKRSHEITNRSRVKVRIEMIQSYGGKCCNCGVDDIDVLDIDHVHNNGAEDRKNNLYGYNLYRRLKKLNWPKNNYQLLCKNCNWKKHLLNIRKSRLTDF
jgi:hypothetical protein